VLGTSSASVDDFNIGALATIFNVDEFSAQRIVVGVSGGRVLIIKDL
jgi:hypothetical protein